MGPAPTSPWSWRDGWPPVGAGLSSPLAGHGCSRGDPVLARLECERACRLTVLTVNETTRALLTMTCPEHGGRTKPAPAETGGYSTLGLGAHPAREQSAAGKAPAARSRWNPTGTSVPRRHETGTPLQ